MKVLILTSYTISNVFKVNYLTERINVVAKVIEKRPVPASYKDKIDIRKKMRKKYGFIKTLNKLLYNKYRNKFITKEHNETLKRELFPSGIGVKYTKEIPAIEVSNINNEECIDFIKKHSPDVIAVCGTTVLKPKVFKLSRKGTINIHCGITPEYRSASPVFWALYNNEPDKVGVTIHFIDEGIDTGDIIYQKAVGVTKDDSIASLYAKCQKTGVTLIEKAIKDIERNEVKVVHKKKSRNREYRRMDLGIWQYMIFLCRFKKLKKKL